MINNEFSTERMHNGKRLIIDLAKFGDDYECIAMYRDGGEIETTHSTNLADGIREYWRLCDKYPEYYTPLTGKYAKLRDDLKEALQTGIDAEFSVTDENGRPKDGGTSNFDATELYLPRWNAAKVEQAALEAGTTCDYRTFYGGRRFCFEPVTNCQGEARTRNAKAVTAFLKSAGWDATICYVTD